MLRWDLRVQIRAARPAKFNACRSKPRSSTAALLTRTKTDFLVAHRTVKQDGRVVREPTPVKRRVALACGVRVVVCTLVFVKFPYKRTSKACNGNPCLQISGFYWSLHACPHAYIRSPPPLSPYTLNHEITFSRQSIKRSANSRVRKGYLPRGRRCSRTDRNRSSSSSRYL